MLASCFSTLISLSILPCLQLALILIIAWRRPHDGNTLNLPFIILLLLRMHEIERRISQTHRKYVDQCVEWEVDPETPDAHPQQLLRYLHHLHEAILKVDAAMRQEVFSAACDCYWNDDKAAQSRLPTIAHHLR